MSMDDTIRAWKDEEYRQSLSEAERALLPESPAGAITLPAAALEAVCGGFETYPVGTYGCCWYITVLGVTFCELIPDGTWKAQTNGCCAEASPESPW